MKNVIIQVKVSTDQKERIDEAYLLYMKEQKEVMTFSEFIRRTFLLTCEEIIQFHKE